MAKKGGTGTRKKKAASAGKRAPVKSLASKKAPKAKVGRRQSWLDDKGQKPLIDQYARQLSTFIEAAADGVIDEKEVAAQEKRVAKLMRDVERQLSDELHASVTTLLCELTAYDIMQLLHAMQRQKPQTRFRG